MTNDQRLLRSCKETDYFLWVDEVSPLFTVVSCPGFFVGVLPWLVPWGGLLPWFPWFGWFMFCAMTIVSSAGRQPLSQHCRRSIGDSPQPNGCPKEVALRADRC
jgi:hypothetical protein